MKLIYCPVCHDILKLQSGNHRQCLCGKSWGSYWANGVDATIGGDAIPLGIDNRAFHDALLHRPKTGLGRTFTAFVIPERCEHITRDVTIKELA